ncbi:hypothetical protein TVAG_154310 [Trichomonas vaginalis G3]|uniref:KATNIP domain-containing protein n=1 Tax=Trichomonas vaginalis (strain ATCC PRA-98 / G3) TaxID=412133 RepID=A2E437_TRIV3|nr:hypothetical protein TVAGG3_0703500 [Trichomonas vaginalis G3]EAY12580.1 hypothetical protein TVAG_154310 [Trichomonas vaginalis G3]KAI5509403.1 hypothetical protein TVAGG3_0703500 [Trichomonas vaginalis G3]|eukprot:XP_001324803.1 hypothetical protein [Trichomonas vaginalis G3]
MRSSYVLSSPKPRKIIRYNSSKNITGFPLHKDRISTFSYTPSKLTRNLISSEQFKIEPIVYNVEFLQSWSSTSEISCSSVWFLDEQRFRIQPMLIKSNYPIDQDMLNKVSDNTLIKTQSINGLKYTYGEKKYENLILTFYFTPFAEPRFCRVWNSPSTSASSVKRFKISLGYTEIVQGEVPQDYGTEVSLIHYRPMSLRSKLQISQVFIDYYRTPVIDKYGAVPLIKHDSIVFEFLKNYGADKMFGLNGIELFDKNLELIPPSDISEIYLEGTINFTNPLTLVNRDEKTGEFSNPFMMEVLKSDICPKIRIEFKEPKVISFVRFFNAKIAGYNNIGIKICRIKIDENNSFVIKFGKSEVVETALNDLSAIKRQIKI